MTSFEVCLKGGAPWGFRLHGGKEFGTPLRISKVEANGKADTAGIKLFDEVFEINGKDVRKVYHTEALVFVKKALNELRMVLNRSAVAESVQEKIANKQNSIVAQKTSSPTSSDSREGMSSYRDSSERERRSNEWSPDIISDVTRVPDPISIEKHAEYEQRTSGDYPNNFNDPNERKKSPQPPTSPRGFEKVKPNGRGRRRMTSSSSLSFEEFEHESMERARPEESSVYLTNSALKHLQCNKAEADPEYHMSRTSSLPRSLGKKAKNADQNRSSTLPRRIKQDDQGKGSMAPTWYKEMYKEINKSMEGQSHLGRLLSADAAKGAFRNYDGATSHRSLPPNHNQPRRQRPKSIHVDRFQFDNIGGDDAPATRDDMNRSQVRSKNSDLERRQQRHSVHSSWYREFQKGGEIPSAGLASDGSEASMIQPVHSRSRSTDDILASRKGLPYQAPDQRSPDNRISNPAKFEYNNPPDFLELRKKAEAEGALREEREREIRMLQEERRRWLEEEEELRAKQLEAKKKTEEERKIQARQMEERLQAQRQKEMLIQKEVEVQRALEIEQQNARNLEPLQPQAKKLNEPNMGRARAIYSFKSQSPAELSFKKGQIFDVFKQIDDNWYEGELDGQIGIFPVNYVEIIETQEEPEEAEDLNLGTMQIEEGIAKARYKFQAENDKELSFKKNDMITLLRKLDENWYEGEIGDQIGIFPVNYVEILREPRIIKNGLQQIVPNNVVMENYEIPERQNGERKEFKPINDERPFQKAPLQQDTHQMGMVVKKEIPKNDVSANQPSLKERQGERHHAVFGYAPMNEDEIELIEGDVVSVLEKCDDGWFVGICERTGKFGTFPGNYVIPF